MIIWRIVSMAQIAIGVTMRLTFWIILFFFEKRAGRGRDGEQRCHFDVTQARL